MTSKRNGKGGVGKMVVNGTKRPVPVRFLSEPGNGADYQAANEGLEILNGSEKPVNLWAPEGVPLGSDSIGWGYRGDPSLLGREVIWVDVNSPKPTEDGSLANPYKSLPTAFATISPYAADWGRKVTVYVAPGTYGVYGSPAEIVVPAGRQIQCNLMGIATINDTFVVHLRDDIAFGEPGNFFLNGSLASYMADTTQHKEFKRADRSYLAEAIYVVNDLPGPGTGKGLNIQLANLEFEKWGLVAEPGGAVDSSWSGAPRFYGAFFQEGYRNLGLWASNVTTRFGHNTPIAPPPVPEPKFFVAENLVLYDGRNCMFGYQFFGKGIYRAQNCVFDGNVTLTTALANDAQFHQHLVGLYNCKFRGDDNTTPVTVTAPGGMFTADRLTVRQAGLVPPTVFAGGCGLGDALGE